MAKKNRKPVPRGFVAFDIESATNRKTGASDAVCLCLTWLKFDEGYVAAFDSGASLDGFEPPETGNEQYLGKDCVRKFLTDLVVEKRWPHFATVAHNLAGFDGHFLLDELVRMGLHEELHVIKDGSGIKVRCARTAPVIRLRTHSLRSHPTQGIMSAGKSEKGEDGERLPAEICITDSILMIPLPLRAACKAFGVKDPKTFFSFKKLDDWYNAGADASYISPRFELEDYKERGEEIETFIAAQPPTFNLAEVMVDYCQRDCTCLIDIMVKYHDAFREVCNTIDPTQHLSPWSYTTGAAAAFSVFMTLVYDPDTMPIPSSPPPLKEYRHSNESDGIKWLALLQHRTEDLGPIQGILHGARVQVPGTRIDCEGRRGDEFFDMQYCKLFGCTVCGPAQDTSLAAPGTGLTKAQLQKARFEKRRKVIESMGFTYTTERTCNFNNLIKPDDVRFELFVATSKYHNVPRLITRNCYSGGRVEPIRLHYKCADDELLRSYDAVSLFPAQMALRDFPIGTPTILYALTDKAAASAFAECVAAQNIDRYFGLIRCRVLVDKARLHHPLVFTHNRGVVGREKQAASACFECGARNLLSRCEHDEDLRCGDCTSKKACPHLRCCSACQLAHMGARCYHLPEERTFWIEATTEEVRLRRTARQSFGSALIPSSLSPLTQVKQALADGDELLEISEVHHWERRGKPLAPFVEAFYRVKQLSSGWSDKVAKMGEGPEKESAKARELAYLDCRWEAAFGKPLGASPEDIVYNGGMRQVAKIVLNSSYGKFGSKPVRSQGHYLTTPEELGKILDARPTKLAVDFIVADTSDGKPVTVMRSETDSTRGQIARETSVVTAAFVTAYGRLQLYNDQLKPAGEGALYCDTDSCLRIEKRDQPPTTTAGEFLGDWGHEPEKDCTEFASLGPKTYALTCVNGNNIVKCKGIGKAAANSSMSVDIFKEVLVGEAEAVRTRSQQFQKTTGCIETESGKADHGWRVKILEAFARTTRLTAAKRQTCAPEYEGGELKTIRTVPFGYSSEEAT